MRRLVYSPRVQAFIRTEANGIVDVSDFIVSGSVSRVVNEVSTAELVLRNVDKQFTQPGNPTFRPMDGITIFGSRYRERPVQLFTGYLDQTPYLQLLPGTCSIRASCTLKRLLHTYWDAGVPHTQQFLSQFGWLPDPTTGTIFSQAGAAQSSHLQSSGQNSPQDIKNALITDGSIGNLLWNVLNQIGGWDNEEIMIEKLPTGIIETVSDIMKSFQADDKQLENELHDFMGNLVGQLGGAIADGVGTIDGTPATSQIGRVGNGADIPSGQTATPEQVAAEMLYAGFPADPQVIANGLGTMFGDPDNGGTATGESGGRAVYNGSCCYGYWQLNVNVGNGTVPCANNLRCSTAYALKLWKAGNCFNCGGGQNNGNPWQAGTDVGKKYLNLAQEVIAKAHAEQAVNHHQAGP